jgi:[acyl-carrier-protein] S-malonyltransferase
VQPGRVLVLAAPGQGAQSPGFLSPWLEIPGVAGRLGRWSEIAGCDLVRCGTTADAAEITDTAIAQPLIVATALAAAEVLLTPGQPGPQIAAGHSVGELAAGAIAGAIGADDAIRLIRVRGQAMAAASAARPTGMTAVLGGDERAVLAAIEAHGLTAANTNGAGQVVAAGTAEALAAFAADPPPGARLRPLAVAGAFHTRHMAPAVDALRDAAATVAARTPAITLLSNADGQPVRSGSDWLQRIVRQVSAPVRWDACMATMARLGAAAFVELPPAGTLAGLARRALPGVRVLALKTPAELDAARGLLAEHGEAHPGNGGETDLGSHPMLGWRLVVAPLAGTFRCANGHAEPGNRIQDGAELGRIESRAGTHPVTASFPATVLEWLAEDGDPVSQGQPLVRLRQESQSDLS